MDKLLSLSKKDFKIYTKRGTGPGGQHRNVTESAVKIVHIPSGASAEYQSERSQHANRKIAFKNLTSSLKFRVWLNKRIYEIKCGKTIDQMVTESITPSTIKVEVKDANGLWIEADEDIINSNLKYDIKSGKMVYEV